MKIVFIGSMSTENNRKKIETAKEKLSKKISNCEFVMPLYGGFQVTIYENQREFIKELSTADLVIAVPKNIYYSNGIDLGNIGNNTIMNHIFGESASYEITIAHNYGIPVLIWKEDDQNDNIPTEQN